MKMIFIIGFNILVYAFGFFIAYGKGMWKNLIFSFTWLLFTIYYFVTPWYFYSVGRSNIWGDDVGYNGVGENISEYYDEGLLYYGIANLLFLIGFFIKKENKFQKYKIEYEDNKKFSILLFLICLILVLFNFVLSGFNLVDIAIGSSEENLFGASGASNYLKNFADSIITCLIICYIARVDRRILIPMIIISFFLFALMGFRYRIIMTILGILFIYLYEYQLSYRKYLRPVIVVASVMYLFVFITINRYELIIGTYNELKYNPVEFKLGEIVTEQTRGMLDDINIIKYYETKDNPEYDYGVTFAYFLVRAMPRAIVGDWKNTLYPPPAFPIIDKAFNLPPVWASTGEAPLHYAYFMIAGNLGFLFCGAFIVGLILGVVNRRKDITFPRDRIFLIVISLALFMWYTRGYFPQFVENLVFLLIPYYVYYGVIKMKYVEN